MKRMNQQFTNDELVVRLWDKEKIRDLMARHCYYYANEWRRKELNDLWVQRYDNRKTASLGNNLGYYEGWENICNFYVGERESQRYARLKEYSDALEDVEYSNLNLGLGQMSTHTANTHLVELSDDGLTAQYLAMDRPDLVNKLVLAVTLSRNNDTVKQVVKKWIEMVQQGAMKELIRDMAEKMYSDSYVKRYRPFFPLLTVLQKPKDIRRFIILADACLTCSTYEELDRIKCPVFVIGGRQDKVVTATASEEIAKKLGCKLYMYEDLGHAAYEEAKDFNQIVYDFLTGRGK